MKRVLAACEESQRVCLAFRELGFEAYSCDIQPCSGGFPEWHIQDDVLKVLSDSWDLVIAFPPCTFLTYAGNQCFSLKKYDIEDIYLRELQRVQAARFFFTFTRLKCHWAIENPQGIMTKLYRKPDQIIQPYNFGEEYSKRTCLWLHDLPPLCPTCHILDSKSWVNTGSRTSLRRSKTFLGIAAAMASQWGGFLNDI